MNGGIQSNVVQTDKTIYAHMLVFRKSMNPFLPLITSITWYSKKYLISGIVDEEKAGWWIFGRMVCVCIWERERERKRDDNDDDDLK